MNGVLGVGEMIAGEYALRLHTLRGSTAHAAYLATTDQLDAALADLEDELRALDADAAPARLVPRDAGSLVVGFSADLPEIVLVDARSFAANDWATLDRRRSSLPDRGVLVFVTTPASFDELMRRAPNLASWLGGQVFAYRSDAQDLADERERRLAALRAWASRTDADIIEAAREGSLPRDPEYAEWLVLLGHDELLGPGKS